MEPGRNLANKTVMGRSIVPRVPDCYLENIEAIAGPFYNIIEVMMKGPNKRSILKVF